MTDTVDAHLRLLDGTLVKTIQIPLSFYVPHSFYVPPQIVVDGDTYYNRTSADAIHDPLDFTIIFGNGVYFVPQSSIEDTSRVVITKEMIASNVPIERRVAPDVRDMSIIDEIYAFAALLRTGSGAK